MQFCSGYRSTNSQLLRRIGLGFYSRRFFSTPVINLDGVEKNQAKADSNQETKIPDGLIAIYKPKGMTSNKVVGNIKYIICKEMQNRTKAKFKIKVGHGGTLDPMAEGVLVLGIGKGTKLLQQVLSGPKGYIAVGRIGVAYDTLDCTGTITESMTDSNIAMISQTHILDALPSFRGNITQVPPMFSALKRDGKRLYDLAREGIEVERKPRNATVYKLVMLDEAPYGAAEALGLNQSTDMVQVKEPLPVELPNFCLNIECSGGFYVRSLLMDLALHVKAVAHMSYLQRTKNGMFGLDDCLEQEQWDFESIVSRIVPVEQLVSAIEQTS